MAMEIAGYVGANCRPAIRVSSITTYEKDFSKCTYHLGVQLDGRCVVTMSSLIVRTEVQY